MIDECWYYSEWTCYTFIATWGEMSFEFSCISLTFMLVGIRYESIIVSEGWENNLLNANKNRTTSTFSPCWGVTTFSQAITYLISMWMMMMENPCHRSQADQKMKSAKIFSIVTSIFINIDVYLNQKDLCFCNFNYHSIKYTVNR